jgi:hypothetical protein
MCLIYVNHPVHTLEININWSRYVFCLTGQTQAEIKMSFADKLSDNFQSQVLHMSDDILKAGLYMNSQLS